MESTGHRLFEREHRADCNPDSSQQALDTLSNNDDPLHGYVVNHVDIALPWNFRCAGPFHTLAIWAKLFFLPSSTNRWQHPSPPPPTTHSMDSSLFRAVVEDVEVVGFSMLSISETFAILPPGALSLIFFARAHTHTHSLSLSLPFPLSLFWLILNQVSAATLILTFICAQRGASRPWRLDAQRSPLSGRPDSGPRNIFPWR